MRQLLGAPKSNQVCNRDVSSRGSRSNHEAYTICYAAEVEATVALTRLRAGHGTRTVEGFIGRV